LGISIWGFVQLGTHVWGLGKNSFGDWKINIWGFVHLGILTIGDFKNTFGDVRDEKKNVLG
jgi:hypothetical protein